uniref:Uncharacterized protein n=1 Tax=Picea glauca TaxID=3330 RepID=A0A101M4C0_PICGL|nr:hypothetical protein ABT39_MTgene572 [Picea glauca]
MGLDNTDTTLLSSYLGRFYASGAITRKLTKDDGMCALSV